MKIKFLITLILISIAVIFPYVLLENYSYINYNPSYYNTTGHVCTDRCGQIPITTNPIPFFVVIVLPLITILYLIVYVIRKVRDD